MLKIATKTNDDSGVVKVAYEQRKRPAARVYIYIIYMSCCARAVRTFLVCIVTGDANQHHPPTIVAVTVAAIVTLLPPVFPSQV